MIYIYKIIYYKKRARIYIPILLEGSALVSLGHEISEAAPRPVRV